VAVGVPDANTRFDVLNAARTVGDRTRGGLRIDSEKREVRVDAAACVRDAALWLPQFEVHGAGESDAPPLVAAVDDLETEVAVERLRAVEVLDLEDDLEDARERRFAALAAGSISTQWPSGSSKYSERAVPKSNSARSKSSSRRSYHSS